jgi:hypothetical protein
MSQEFILAGSYLHEILISLFSGTPLVKLINKFIQEQKANIYSAEETLN